MRDPSEIVPREVCERLEIALLIESVHDEICVMCGWDCVKDEERKGRVRRELAPYFGEKRIVFAMLPDLDESRVHVKQLLAALYK